MFSIFRLCGIVPIPCQSAKGIGYVAIREKSGLVYCQVRTAVGEDLLVVVPSPSRPSGL